MRKKRDLSTEKIIYQAAKLLEVEGREGLSLHKLARSLKIKTPSLYNHISSYDDLMEELSIYGMKILMNKWSQRDIDLETLMDLFLEFASEHPVLCKLTQSPPIKVSTKWNQQADNVAQIPIQVIGQLSKNQDEVVHKVRFLRSFLYGFSYLLLEEGFQKEDSLKETYIYAKKGILRLIKDED